jgi:mevalonate kinase
MILWGMDLFISTEQMAGSLSNQIFHGKLLLFGEYSVIEGSKALAIPYTAVSAQLAFRDENTDLKIFRESSQSLRSFASFLADGQDHQSGRPPVDVKRFNSDLDRGLYCRSNIPGKYGLGSSGAVCAAVYNEYGPATRNDFYSIDHRDIQSVRETLASMESHFHGQSSGIDPLCIYYNKPMIADGKNKVIVCNDKQLINNGIQAFLMDTGMTGNTGELVNGFRMKLLEQGLKKGFTRQYIPFVNHLVDRFTNGILTFDMLLQLSAFQSGLFHEMIPEKFHSVWQYGLDSEYYVCKLCGSGGGGYILGFTEDFDKASLSLYGRYNIKPVQLNIG